MKLLLAPIQGVTIAEYRNSYDKFFGGFDGYYAPFISPTTKEETHPSFFNDVLPEVNSNTLSLVPQLLGNDGNNFRDYAATIVNMGYKEINWNIGCSFSIVTKKKKGAGILPHPDMIKRVLDEVCKDTNYDLTVKMRLGMNHTDEGIKVIESLNDYPLSGVMIHARTGIQQYNGHVDLDAFQTLYSKSKHKMTYNGDIYTYEDYKKIQNRFPELDSFMLGRGALIDPFLASTIKGDDIPTDQKLKIITSFHHAIYNHYKKNKPRENHFLNKMKEFWTYTHVHLDPENQFIKRIRLSQTNEAYLKVVKEILKDTNQWIEKM
ncbi:MAG: tRNA-dihydrouridine synthase family protein [Clostridiales bacterium]|nr:tRNA-dihydrouridine synthase family protein [Clostridiales bacterium]